MQHTILEPKNPFLPSNNLLFQFLVLLWHPATESLVRAKRLILRFLLELGNCAVVIQSMPVWGSRGGSGLGRKQ